MDIREWVNNNAGVVTISAVLVMVMSLIYIFFNSGAPKAQMAESQWFYDLTTKKLFAAPMEEYAPIDTPSGPKQGVKAMVYACPDSDCKSDPRIAWLEMYTPKVKKLLLEQKERDREGITAPDMTLVRLIDEDQGTMYARAEKPDEWHAAHSPRARELKMSLNNLCGEGVQIRGCLP